MLRQIINKSKNTDLKYNSKKIKKNIDSKFFSSFFQNLNLKYDYQPNKNILEISEKLEDFLDQ